MSHRWVAGYGIDRSLIGPWLEHQVVDLQGFDEEDMLSRFTHMVFPIFIRTEHLKTLAPMVLGDGERIVILVRSFGQGKKSVKETDKDREVKQLLLEHSGLEEPLLKWETLRTA